MRLLPILSAALLTAALLPGARPAAAQSPAAATPPLEINLASEAQLDGLRGLGPATTRRILAARAERPFADWRDLIGRVKGLGPQLAARLSQDGLTVQGQAFEAPAPR